MGGSVTAGLGAFADRGSVRGNAEAAWELTDAMVAKLGGTVPPPSFGDLVDVDFEDGESRHCSRWDQQSHCL